MCEKKRYRICIKGCDDHTEVDLLLSKEELLLVDLIAEKSRENSRCVCQPILRVLELPDED